jgi:TolA-binding protein
MVRVSKKDWPALAKKINYIDPVLVQDEEERKRKLELEIIMNVGTVQDRQNQEYWRERQKEIEEEKKELEEKKRLRAEKKKNLASIPGKILKGVLSGDKNKPRASSGSRPVKGRKAPAEKRSKPMRFEDREFEMPDFNPPGWAR